MESGRGGNGCNIRGGGAGGKKMRKRKELDALVGGVSGKRVGGSKRPGSGGVSAQDQLLSESTGEEDYWGSKSGGKGKRRYPGSGGKRGGGTCTALLRLCTILLIMACVVATITVMWLFIDIREQTTYLRSQLDQVAAGTQGVPEEIQQCHSLTRQLQNNQTQLFSRLALVSQKLLNFTNMINVVQGGLSNVQSKLHESPELINVPKDLQALYQNVASITSSMQDVQTTTLHLSDGYKTLFDTVDRLFNNITELNIVLNELKDFVHQNVGNMSNSNDAVNDKKSISIASVLDTLNKNITTLFRQLAWAVKDQHKDNKVIEVLQENSNNMSTHLLSLQSDFSLYKSKYDQLAQNVTQMKILVMKNAVDITYAMSNLTKLNSFVEKEKSQNVSNIISILSKIETPEVTSVKDESDGAAHADTILVL